MVEPDGGFNVACSGEVDTGAVIVLNDGTQDGKVSRASGVRSHGGSIQRLSDKRDDHSPLQG